MCLHETGVVAAHVADLNHLAWTCRALEPKRVVLRQRRRARLLQEEVLARPQHLDGERAVIHRACGEDDRVHVVTSEQLGVAAVGDPEPPPHLLGSPLTGRGDRDQLSPRQPLRVLGVEGSHPAETGDA